MTQYLTRKEAAALLGIAPKTLANWASVGYGPRVTRIGARCHYSEIDLEKFVKSQQKEKAA